jgi:hypothetical protein
LIVPICRETSRNVRKRLETSRAPTTSRPNAVKSLQPRALCRRLRPPARLQHAPCVQCAAVLGGWDVFGEGVPATVIVHATLGFVHLDEGADEPAGFCVLPDTGNAGVEGMGRRLVCGFGDTRATVACVCTDPSSEPSRPLSGRVTGSRLRRRPSHFPRARKRHRARTRGHRDDLRARVTGSSRTTALCWCSRVGRARCPSRAQTPGPISACDAAGRNFASRTPPSMSLPLEPRGGRPSLKRTCERAV